jgi:hypothetical protein
VEDATRAVVALHATDPATVFLSLQARVRDVTVADVERALYTDRTVLRLLAMRRTLFVVPVGSVPVVQAAASRSVGQMQRRRYLKLLTEAANLSPKEATEAADLSPKEATEAAWLADVEAGTLRALRARGEAAGAELSADEPRLRTSVHVAADKSYGGPQNITSWVLNLLALDGHIVRARPRGSWVSQQWRWAPATAWLPGGLGDLPVEAARTELVRLWLAAFGPAPVSDIKWWTGWPLGNVRAALAAIGPEEVDLDGTPGVMLPGDDDDTEPEPWIALLPALDPTPMGWAGRSWFLGPHGAPDNGPLFDRNGNIGPTVWCDGRIVGGWAQRRRNNRSVAEGGDGGEVVFRLLEDIGSESAAAVETAAAGLTAWVGPVRVVPRFRTPLEKELTA